MGRMGLRGRIRRWVGRHWCRDLAELREQVQRSVNDRAALMKAFDEQAVHVELMRLQIDANERLMRDVQKDKVRLMAEMAVAHKKLLAEDLSKDLARIITAHGLVGCRLSALAERMGLGMFRERACNTGEPEKDKMEEMRISGVHELDEWGIQVACGSVVRFVRTAGMGVGSCKIECWIRDGGHHVERRECPVSPKLSRALMKFLSRVHQEGQSGGTDRERERIRPP